MFYGLDFSDNNVGFFWRGGGGGGVAKVVNFKHLFSLTDLL